LKEYEWAFHILPLGFGFGTSIYSLVDSLYGYASLWCWIRGDEVFYRLAFYYAALWPSMVIIALGMFSIYRTAVEIEKDEVNSSNHTSPEQCCSLQAENNASASEARKRTKQVAMQAIFYGTHPAIFSNHSYLTAF